MPSIKDKITRTISYADELKDERDDSPLSIAFDCLDHSFMDDYNETEKTFTISADSDEELEEKTSALISAMEYQSLNIIINVDSYDKSDLISGFNTEILNLILPEHFIEFKDEEYNELVVFFNDHESIFSKMSEEDRVLYANDFPINNYINGLFKELNIVNDIKACGEILILNKETASGYVKLS